MNEQARASHLRWWALENIILVCCIVAGQEGPHKELLYIGAAYLWANFLAAFGLLLFWPLYRDARAAIRSRMLIGEGYIPWHAAALIDIVLALYLLANEWYLTGALHLLQAFMVVQLRANAHKFNAGLVQLAAQAETKLDLTKEK